MCVCLASYCCLFSVWFFSFTHSTFFCTSTVVVNCSTLVRFFSSECLFWSELKSFFAFTAHNHTLLDTHRPSLANHSTIYPPIQKNGTSWFCSEQPLRMYSKYFLLLFQALLSPHTHAYSRGQVTAEEKEEEKKIYVGGRGDFRLWTIRSTVWNPHVHLMVPKQIYSA